MPSKFPFGPVQNLMAAVVQRGYPLLDKTLLRGDAQYALESGEWVAINADEKVIRATTITSVGNPATGVALPVFMERGRSDAQALSSGLTNLLYSGSWIFFTEIFDAAAVIGSGAVISALHQPLKVATIVVDGRNYSGLVGHGGSGDTAPIACYVAGMPAKHQGKLHIRKHLP
jgi:hypothetical protein